MLDTKRGGTSVLNKLFAHNTWANLKLLDYCEGLSAAQLDTTAIGGFGSIRDTLVHIIGAEVSYVYRVNGRLPTTSFSKGQFPGFEVLKDTVRWTGDELLQLAFSTQQDTTVREHEKRLYVEYTLASLMVQAVSHSIEHRTQIATIITQLGPVPPDMSGWKYMEETGELQEGEEGAEAA
ncbi:MAG: DinB family protein [Herpetosiphonaceae bacterium]|nr:DinB family protein [Herpetosiphonaceae bacterium]